MNLLNNKISNRLAGRAIAQAVSRWLPTAAAWVRARVWSCGICGGQSGIGAGFLRVLQFPLPIFIPPIALHSPSSIIWGWYKRPVVAAVPSGLSLTPLRIIIIKQRPGWLLEWSMKVRTRLHWPWLKSDSSYLWPPFVFHNDERFRD
jgi:hypothetical protein